MRAGVVRAGVRAAFRGCLYLGALSAWAGLIFRPAVQPPPAFPPSLVPISTQLCEAGLLFMFTQQLQTHRLKVRQRPL